MIPTPFFSHVSIYHCDVCSGCADVFITRQSSADVPVNNFRLPLSDGVCNRQWHTEQELTEHNEHEILASAGMCYQFRARFMFHSSFSVVFVTPQN